MAENIAICLVGAMDRLWFHQIVLFQEPNSPVTSIINKPLKNTPPFSESLSTSTSASTNSSQSLPIPENDQLSSAPSTPQEKQTNPGKNINIMTTTSAGNGSVSSSLETGKGSRSSPRYSGSVRRLKKTMSCKSLMELELEEVKGFMDLGFVFDKEDLCPKIMSFIPGLQRLGSCKIEEEKIIKNEEEDDDIEEGEKNNGMMRPYLSEAWLVNRPDSPLLNLRIPRVSTAAEMKKHLRFWAKAVANVVRQES